MTSIPARHRSVQLAVALVLLAVVTGALDAQKPERQKHVEVPGRNIPLKVGWRLLFHDGCRFAVPGTWRAEADASTARAADGSNISIRTFTITSWTAHKAQVKAAFGHPTLVHEDSDTRLWFEIGDKSRIQHYVDVASGSRVCSGLLELRAATTPEADDTAKRIVESVGPAPDK